MNISCFQYNQLKDCTKFEITYRTILGVKRNRVLVEVPITEQQYYQSHKKLVYGHKWEQKVTNNVIPF